MVFKPVAAVLRRDPRLGYALVFGSCARGTPHAHSDLDIAIGGLQQPLTALELGDLISRLEQAAGRTVDLVVLDEANPSLAYRIFKDGRVLLERDPAAMASRKAQVILEYLDWKPIEDLFAAAGRHEGTRGR